MGSSGRYYFIAITVLCFGATILPQHLVSSRDLHEEVACYRDRMRVNCGDQSFIAIHEAFFTTQVQDNTTCGPSAIEHEHPTFDDESSSTDATQVSSSGCYEDIRVSINRRCSGSKSCNYSYHEQPFKKCPNMRGQYVVRYDCVRNKTVSNYCNTKLENREGYFSSPGFPQYYPQLDQCGWTISSSAGQTVLLKILHLHLRPATEVVPTAFDPDSLYPLPISGQMVSEEDTKCDVDSLTILEGNVKRASVCGEGVSALKVLEMESGAADVNFKSATFNPASGFLMYYKIQGCPVLTSSDGLSHLAEGNNSASVYACKGDRVFNDTLENERYLSCVRDHHWNDTLPPCISLDSIATTTTAIQLNESTEEMQLENSTLPNPERTTAEAKKAGLIEDIIIPSVLIGVLLVVNAIIITVILIIRKRHKAKFVLEDEIFEDPKSEPLVADVKDV